VHIIIEVCRQFYFFRENELSLSKITRQNDVVILRNCYGRSSIPSIRQWKAVIIACFSTSLALRRLQVRVQKEEKKKNAAFRSRSFYSNSLW